MPPVLRTKKDQAAVTIAGVGRMPANQVGGILLDVAAAGLPEFQDADGVPLEGDELLKAAEAFAEQRGYDVSDVSDDKADKLNELAGAAPDRPPLADVAAEHPFAKASAAAGAQTLRGQALDDALDELGLSKSGTADEKRARVAAARAAAGGDPVEGDQAGEGEQPQA